MGDEDIDVELVGLDLGIVLGQAAKRSSQYGMVRMMPFDLVAEVTWRRAAPGGSKAYRITPLAPQAGEDRVLDAISSALPR